MKAILSILFTFAFVVSAGSVAFADAAAGAKLFKKKCKSCHSTSIKNAIGSHLTGVSKRHSATWMKKWIADPQGVWAANGADVAELKKRVGGESRPETKMKVKVKAKDIDNIVDYLMTL